METAFPFPFGPPPRVFWGMSYTLFREKFFGIFFGKPFQKVIKNHPKKAKKAKM